MKKTILAVLAMGALSCALFNQQAQAVPMTGTLNLGGAVQFDSSSLNMAHSVNVWFDSNGNAGHSTVLPGNTGTFASIPAGTQADMARHNPGYSIHQQPWIFNPSTPTQHFWSVAGFTFNLMSSTIMHQDATALVIVGSGIVSGNGFDATNMDWAFSTQSAGGATHFVFSFSANGPAGVPDGGATVMLLGVALSALGMARRFLKS
jgi:VPDSG-CTERM motif